MAEKLCLRWNDFQDNVKNAFGHLRDTTDFVDVTLACEDGRKQGCISCGTCSYPKLTEDHVLTSAYVKIFRTVTRNAVNKGV